MKTTAPARRIFAASSDAMLWRVAELDYNGFGSTALAELEAREAFSVRKARDDARWAEIHRARIARAWSATSASVRTDIRDSQR